MCKYFLLTIKQLLQAFVYARKPELQFPDEEGPAVIIVCHDLTLCKSAFHRRGADAEAVELHEKT